MIDEYFVTGCQNNLWLENNLSLKLLLIIWRTRAFYLKVNFYHSFTKKFCAKNCKYEQIWRFWFSPQNVFPVRKVCRIHPMILEQSNGSKHARKKPGLCTWLTGAIDSDFDSLVVGGHQAWMRIHSDGHGKWFSTATSAHKPQITELGHLDKNRKGL